eukprot:1156404-Pelagomonas_calceolata.AAC.9
MKPGLTILVGVMMTKPMMIKAVIRLWSQISCDNCIIGTMIALQACMHPSAPQWDGPPPDKTGLCP